MSADLIGAGILPPALVHVATRLMRRCGEHEGPDSEALVAACALALHQLSQGHTRVDLSRAGRVLLAPRDMQRSTERIEIAVPASLVEAVARAVDRGSAAIVRMDPTDAAASPAPMVLEGESLSLARCREIDDSSVACWPITSSMGSPLPAGVSAKAISRVAPSTTVTSCT